MRYELKGMIVEHINNTFDHARKNGATKITLLSGAVHKSLGLESRLPSVCNAMYSCMKDNDRVISTTPKGNSSTILIEYNL